MRLERQRYAVSVCAVFGRTCYYHALIAAIGALALVNLMTGISHNEFSNEFSKQTYDLRKQLNASSNRQPFLRAAETDSSKFENATGETQLMQNFNLETTAENGRANLLRSKHRRDLRWPSKPLDAARLESIKNVKPESLKWVDVAGNYSEDPHLGGRDVYGNFGYVIDPTALRKDPPPFDLENLDATCATIDDDYKMLTEKVFVDLHAHEEAEKSGRTRAKILCIVYTTENNHAMIPYIRQTWGPKCDGFMVSSNKTDESINAVDIPHEGIEDYYNIWQKIRSTWSYVYDNFYEDYDWFHIGGDDMYLIVENLRLYLESEEIKLASNGGIHLPNGDETSQVPLALGCRFAFQGDRNDTYNAGGPGYTFNKAALKLLVVKGLPQFFVHDVAYAEDLMIGHVFRNFGLLPYDTKDEMGGERYNNFYPGYYYTYEKPPPNSTYWYFKFSIDVKYGADHSAARSVSFHYVMGDHVARLHAILYLCPQQKIAM